MLKTQHLLYCSVVYFIFIYLLFYLHIIIIIIISFFFICLFGQDTAC